VSILVVSFLLAAAPPNVTEAIRWSAPAECPSERELRERVEGALRRGGSGHRAEIDLHLDVIPASEGYELTVTMLPASETGTRKLVASNCDELTNAAVLIVALAIDPELRPEPSDAPSVAWEPKAPDPPALILNPPQPSTPASSERGAVRNESRSSEEPSALTQAGTSVPAVRKQARRSKVIPVVAFDLGVGTGRLARLPMPFLRVGAGIDHGRFRGLFRLSGVGPSVGTVDDQPARALLGLVTLGAAACVQSLGSRWRAIGCLGSDVGVAFGTGLQFRTSFTPASPWWGMEGEIGFEARLSARVSLGARAGGGVVLANPRFVVDEQGRACCERFGASLSFGVVTFWGKSQPGDARAQGLALR